MKAGKILFARLAIAGTLLCAWQAMSASGLFYRDVVPPIERVLYAFADLLASQAFWGNLEVTGLEIAGAVAIGGLAGLCFGILIGGNRFLSRAYEPLLHYLGPTPKIIFFPVLIMWFGVGGGSKIAMGALSAFFPVALSAAAGMRQIDPVLIRVGRSFGASAWQMAVKVILPAMRAPILNGIRLGFGIAVIGTLLAETKLSNKGLGFLIIQSYIQFDMPRLYAMLCAVFALSALANALLNTAADWHAGRSRGT